MSPLRIAFVGCGLISEAHLRGYAPFADRVEIKLCFDTDRAKAEAFADKTQSRVAPSYQAILEDPNIDAVELLTPPHVHLDQVTQALTAGKHVSCQKPLARTLEECDQMIAAEIKTGKVLFYAEMLRTASAGQIARKTVEEGRIGKLVAIQATYAHRQTGAYLTTPWRYDPAMMGGGQLLDGGIHHIDLMRVVGGDVAEVSCFTTRFREELGGEDTATVNLRFTEGHLGTLVSTHASGLWFPGPGFAAIGTEGILTIGGPQGAVVLHRPDLPDTREVLLTERPDPFAEMARHFLDVVQNGAKNTSTAQVARDDLAIVLAAYQSAQEKRTIPL